MLALQGPHSTEILNPLVKDDISQLRYYRSIESLVLDVPAAVSRTGYTGEDGFEVMIPVEHAVELMGGLSTLRPGVLQELLEACRSIKVKRLFLWAAEHSGHSWFARLSPGTLDLGVGKRVLYRGGRLDRTYHITVPPPEALRGV